LECLLNLPHLVVKLVKAESAEIGMAPSMGSDLVSMIVNVLDTLDFIVIINARVVITIVKECPFSVSSYESLADVVRVHPGTIIKSQGNSVWNGASRDDCRESARLVGRLRSSLNSSDQREGSNNESVEHCERRKGRGRREESNYSEERKMKAEDII
jgi:hypothetical protein